MGEESSGLSVLLVIVSLAGGWAWGWTQLSTLARRRGWSNLARYGLCLGASLITALGAAFLAGALLMPGSGDGGSAVAGGFGVVLLAPFAWLHWRNRKAAPAVGPVAVEVSPSQGEKSPEHVSQEDQAPASNSKKKPRASVGSAPLPAMRITLPHRFRIQYRDEAISWEQRDVRVDRISSNGPHTYLEGFCELRRAPRTFRTDRIRGDVLDLETGELLPLRRLLADVVERSQTSFKPTTTTSPSRGTDAAREWQQAAFFAGFSASKRDELEALAEDGGWQVRRTISNTVNYFVAGGMAGKNQIADAERRGIPVIDEDTFRALI